MAGVQGSLQVYSNDGQTLLYSGDVQLNSTTFVITQSGFTDNGVATNINYGIQISGWSATQGATIPDYDVNTQYVDVDIISEMFGGTYYVVPVQDNKFVSTAGLNVLVNKIKSKQDKITSTSQLDADFVNDLFSNNKFVTSTQISTWNGKQDAITSTNKLDYALIANTPTIPTDTGATSITTSGSGNAVTTASYDASTRKITLTKGSTFLTSAPVTSVSGRTGAVTKANLVTDLITGAVGYADKIASKSMGASGYITFSSGLKIAWGVANHKSSAYDWTANISFGITFTNNPTVVSTPLEASGSGCWSYVSKSLSTTGCTLRQTSKPNANGKAQYIYWIAIGY